MTSLHDKWDAIIIGGGFYGAVIAQFLAQQKQFNHILVLEKESKLLQRASYNNQARVHNGFHYPRSFITAFRSRVNYRRFLQDWGPAIDISFTKVYALASKQSKVSVKQFERFCSELGAPILTADKSISDLFSNSLISKVYVVEECAFNAARLEAMHSKLIRENGIHSQYATQVKEASLINGEIVLKCESQKKMPIYIQSRYVFNCTYSGLNSIKGDFEGCEAKLKHEITELGIVTPPDHMKDLGITVMDGSFFSVMPFPALNAHSFSHVRFTPHCSWIDTPDIDPYQRLATYQGPSRLDRMIRDASRYLPDLRKVHPLKSLFEVKTVLVENEVDDGRPILFQESKNIPNFFSILGGKIDNIYDILERLSTLNLKARRPLGADLTRHISYPPNPLG